MSGEGRPILQLCHGYYGPFLDCARQYARLFRGTPHQVVTVQLIDQPDEKVIQTLAPDEVIFLGHESEAMSGLKWKVIREVRRIAASRDFCLCIAQRFKSMYTGLLATDLPVIGVHHTFGDYRRLGRRLFASAFKKRLRLLGVSDAIQQDIRAALPAWPASRIATLYNRIDVDAVQSRLISRETARAALGLPLDSWVVGNVGRLHPDKDQATLIRAFALARPSLPSQSVLAIMGSGRLENALKALANELGVIDGIRFLGQVEEGRRYFKAFDVFALSSDREPFGMVLLEALAAHLPVVCSDCGGGREVVAEIGDLFPFGNAEALAQCLIRLAGRKMPADYPERVQRHLREKFSDEAAQKAFWELPMVREILA
ncbi:MAG: glycosyltransferase [Azoarcus sp.]|jgi:glycosyltransferase involved in cell wall biosynthesis|nr:glycosyltransferase [Azoarcus sp.]